MRNTLKQRSEFLNVKKYGQAVHTSSFLVQYYLSPQSTDKAPSLSEIGINHGFTVTKRLGNAVIRNRIKRRLREAYRFCLKEINFDSLPSQQTLKLVIIAKTQMTEKAYQDIIRDMRFALQKIQRELQKRQEQQKA